MIPSTAVTDLFSIANIAHITAVDTPEATFNAHEGLAPSQSIPVSVAAMFLTAYSACS